MQFTSSMDFFKSRYYRYNAVLLTFVGLWPYHSSKWKRFQQMIIYIDIITVMTVQIIKMVEIWGDVDIMIECFTPAAIQLAACSKAFNLMFNRDKVKKLLDNMQKDWSSLTNDREKKIFWQFAENSRFMTLAYAICLFASLIVYLMIPLLPAILNVVLPLNETRQRRSLYHTEHFVNPDDNYVPIAVHTYSGTILTISIHVAVDSLLATYVQHASGLLAIVGDRLERLSEEVKAVNYDQNVTLDNNECHQVLIRCIKRHQDAIKFALLIESTYSNLLLLQLSLGTIVISMSLLQLLSKFGQYAEMYRLVQFTGAQLVHLYYNSLTGQKLIDQSVTLRKSVYYADWHEFSLKSQNLIKIVMIGAGNPLKITAGKFYDMSMENYGMVVQTSLSYFTVLASVR